ncbi:MAG: protein phosphatase 2C domain-containing protein [Pirellulales bacterium]|nr:protein phosphatase 2C domain-containing protein [Pirellulales bacterium]
MAGLSGDALALLEALRRESQDSLATTGNVCARSGVLAWSDGSLAIHTDFGPEGQDKDTNQDFALAWTSGNEEDALRWAVALADGVTSSWHAEHAAELACWKGLESLIQSSPSEVRARDAFSAAGNAIGRVGDSIEADAEAYLPEGEFASTWRFTLREGLLLQTTLSFTWMENGTIHLAFVGDGGATVELCEGNQKSLEIVGDIDDCTNRVHALGPRNRQVSESDVYRAFDEQRVRRIGMYTDGVGRGLNTSSRSFLEELDDAESLHQNVAARLIAGWVNSAPNQFEDNLSLAVVTRK